MKPVLLSTADNAPIAFLLVSDSGSGTGDCTFVIAVRDKHTHDSLEAQTILPDRPTEYRCSIVDEDGATSFRFENQNGWMFSVDVAVAGEGEWHATKDGQRLSGRAMRLP